jgi:hypothetical protein
MPTSRRYHGPKADRRRALELLAGSRYGYTKAILRAHGFSIDMMNPALGWIAMRWP